MMGAPNAAVGLLCALAVVVRADEALADVPVPVQLQAQLAAKVSAFDRNFSTRAEGTARVLVVEKGGDDDSADIGAHFARALSALGTVAGSNVQVEVEPFTNGPSLAEQCRSRRVSMVYLSTRLDSELGAVATALAGVDVLTIGASGAYVARGAVVGFDLEEGKPRIVVNLARAKAQNVSFRAELLKLARVIMPDAAR